MANGGIQQILEKMDAVVRIEEAALTSEEATEYGAWKRLGMALGHFADIVAKNEQDGFFTVGLLATCPSMPGLVAGATLRTETETSPNGMLWLDAHLTSTLLRPRVDRWVGCRWRSRPLRLRLDAHLDPPLSDQHVVMGGRLTDPLEQQLLDKSSIQQLVSTISET